MTNLWKKLTEATEARVMSSACRAYVVLADPSTSDRARLMKDRHGTTQHFVSLAQVRDALRHKNAKDISYIEHYVCEELGTPDEEVGI